jgi:transcriptional regulator with GAF, ATPase, and Fis domain
VRDVLRSGRSAIFRVAELPATHGANVSLQDLGVHVVACVPIRGSSATLGVLYLDSRQEALLLARAPLAVLDLFAAQAAVALEQTQAHDEAVRALETAEEALRRHRSEARERYDDLVGASPAMQAVYRSLELIAPSEEPVLVLGETGTGKELVARAIHARGPRREREFVALNCAALPETLLESELFGHVRGAFTGADEARAGLFEVAHRGTLFLDEIGDMGPRMQASLLRVLQSGELRRLGSRAPARVDVRVIAATHRDLEKQVRRGEFREDLYFRLNVLRLDLPPLRERPEDIPQLAREILRRIVRGRELPELSPRLIACLMAQRWPGNVRELENVLRQLAVLGERELDAQHLPERLRRQRGFAPPARTLREAELETIRRTLETVNGNKAKAARILGVDRKTLYARLKEMG